MSTLRSSPSTAHTGDTLSLFERQQIRGIMPTVRLNLPQLLSGTNCSLGPSNPSAPRSSHRIQVLLTPTRVDRNVKRILSADLFQTSSPYTMGTSLRWLTKAPRAQGCASVRDATIGCHTDLSNLRKEGMARSAPLPSVGL